MNSFPKNVNFLSTSRFIEGGQSLGNFDNFNLGLHVNDNRERVLRNRSILKEYYALPSDPVWINQSHSSRCIDVGLIESLVDADASFTSDSGIVCGILTADCLPVFVSNKDGSRVGIAHAGWKGLISGVIENLIESFDCNGNELLVYFGPAISVKNFEVGEEIKGIYLSKNNNFERSFSFSNGKLYLDLYDAARVILKSLNVKFVFGGNRCTYQESEIFFSYRRDGLYSGRMAHLIWMD